MLFELPVKKMNPTFFNILTLLALTLSFFPSFAAADIYRCDKQAGVITLSNVEKGKNCTKMILPPPEKRPQNPPVRYVKNQSQRFSR
ncbi:DUF4124 domain-containing protein [Polynucleobacter necessarius]|uniref:DUF4124 domain-containing protein n=1 Tax=Polynucleobacter necessarius TaxID=576610 RepID=UPI000E09B0B1|nr:DUF4124 domain-containing protein [Polynucleobacter necessarius]